MSTAIASKLLELEARAGASDQDREAWLAERRRGITATEIRDLYLGKITIPELVKLKLGITTDSFAGNQYTRWGNEREPIIAAELQRRFMIAPEHRVFRAADDPRKLASPDGVGVGFDGELVVDEIKTHGDHLDIAPGTETYEAKGYFIQKVWVMRVIGARRCVYAAEPRIMVAGGFAPGVLRTWWVEWDAEAAALAEELEVLADRFLAALDAAADREPIEPEIDEELDTLAVNYLRGLDLEKQAKDLKEPAYRAMFERLDAGESVVQESPLARVSFTPAVVEERPVIELDATAAALAAPAGLYERLEQASDDLRQAAEAFEREQAAVTEHEAKFMRQVRTERVTVKKASLRVTAGKNTKEKN